MDTSFLTVHTSFKKRLGRYVPVPKLDDFSIIYNHPKLDVFFSSDHAKNYPFLDGYRWSIIIHF